MRLPKKIDPVLLIFVSILILWIIVNIFYIYINDILEVIVILLLIFYLVWTGVRRQQTATKLLCYCGASYIFIRALLLPLMFTYAINNNSGIIVDNETLTYEQQSELTNIDRFFALSDTSNINALRSLLTNNDSLKGCKISFKGSPFKDVWHRIDTFSIKEDRHFNIQWTPRTEFTIYGTHGSKLGHTIIKDYTVGRHRLFYHDRSPKAVVVSIINNLEKIKKETGIRRNQLLERKMTWTYSMLLPYVLFDSDVMKFQKPIAVSLHGLSKILCEALLLALVSTSIWEILLKRMKSDGDETL